MFPFEMPHFEILHFINLMKNQCVIILSVISIEYNFKTNTVMSLQLQQQVCMGFDLKYHCS